MHSGEGLVHEEEMDRTHHEASGDLEQHALPARKLFGQRVALPVERDDLQQPARVFEDLRPRAVTAAVERRQSRKQDVLQHRHVAEHLRGLKGPGDTPRGDLVRAQAVDPLAAQLDLSGIGAIQAREQVDGGRLARAVGTDEAADLSRTDRERKPVHRDQAAEPLGEPARLEQPPVRGGGRHTSGSQNRWISMTAGLAMTAPRRGQSVTRSVAAGRPRARRGPW